TSLSGSLMSASWTNVTASALFVKSRFSYKSHGRDFLYTLFFCFGFALFGFVCSCGRSSCGCGAGCAGCNCTGVTSSFSLSIFAHLPHLLLSASNSLLTFFSLCVPICVCALYLSRPSYFRALNSLFSLAHSFSHSRAVTYLCACVRACVC